MDQDRKGVIGQVPSSHMAHFKLEHNLIWGSERIACPHPPSSQGWGLTAVGREWP